jgi:thymidylate synthase ThyX
MRVTGVSFMAPSTAKDNPALTPELMAACGARYSRNNEGLEKILSLVDKNNTDKSVDSIFRMADYGHASIMDMVPVALFIDGISMYMAYMIYHYAQMAAGQESSTRYIPMNAGGLMSAEEVGIPAEFAKEWKDLMLEGMERYQQECRRLDVLAEAEPERVRYPQVDLEKLTPDQKEKELKKRDRMRRNYYLDRARYFLPFTCRTNMMLIASARIWSEVIKLVESLPQPEPKSLASLLRAEYKKYSPRLEKHAYTEPAAVINAQKWVDDWTAAITKDGIPIKNNPGKVVVSVNNDLPDFMRPMRPLSASVDGKRNRYSPAGNDIKRIFVRAAWPNMSVAELRDLNRHRTGTRVSSMVPNGFYLPPEIQRKPHEGYLKRHADFGERLVKSGPEGAAAWPYAMLLGTQVPFEYATMGDKFVYMLELRTGLGAHFHYAELMRAAGEELIRLIPDLKPCIQFGTAAPE